MNLLHRVPTQWLRLLLSTAIVPITIGAVIVSGASSARGAQVVSDLPACEFATATQGAATMLSFDPIGSACTWSPANGITSATFTLYGAAGAATAEDPGVDGGGTQGTGGLGSEVIGTLSGIGGVSFELNVGGGGTNTSSSAESQTGTGSFNGGGSGTTFGGDGGGATDIRVGAFGATDRVLVAGGGGGGGSAQSSPSGGNGGEGDTNGSPGGLNECTAAPAGGGFGGGAAAPNQGLGGVGSPIGTGDCSESYTHGADGTSGTAAGIGGSGSPFTGAFGIGGGGGGGGGGGYFGGGGGASGGPSDSDVVAFSGDGGGGGGSSYTGGADGFTPTGTSVTDPVSPAAPGGFILISYSIAAAATTTTTTAATTTTTSAATVASAAPTTTTTVPNASAALAVTGIDVWSTVFSGGCFLAAGIILVLASAMEIRRRRIGLG